MSKRYTGTCICIECGEEWEIEKATDLVCEECGGELRAVGDLIETDEKDDV